MCICIAEERGKGPLMTAILLHCPTLGMQGAFLVSLTNSSPKLGDKPLLKPVNVESIGTRNEGSRVPKQDMDALPKLVAQTSKVVARLSRPGAVYDG